MNRIHLTCLLLILIIFVSSCDKNSFDNRSSPTNVRIPISTGNGCYKSFHEFAYMLSDADFPEMLLPMTPWQIVTTLSDEQLEGYFVNDFEVQLVRSINDNQEIWITKSIMLSKPQNDSAFGIYLPETQEWREVPARIENTDLFVRDIYLTSDGAIWGKTEWQESYGEGTSPNQSPVLSKFNEYTRRFELSSGVLEIPFTHEQSLSPKIVLDEQDVFWIFTQHGGLYRYDSKTQITTKQADFQNLNVADTAIASDGSIFIQDRNSEKLYSRDSFFRIYEGMLSQFIPDTGEFVPVKIPDEPWPNFTGMLVSETGQLWLGAIGYRQVDETWHLMHPNPNNYFEHAGDYSWAPPHLMLESSDGRLWYQKYLGASLRNEGTAWYDPETGKGCMFTNIPANIIEDDQQQLWMFADRKLYRYSLEE